MDRAGVPAHKRKMKGAHLGALGQRILIFPAAMLAVLSVLCLGWVLLSQIAVSPSLGGPVCLGLDGALSFLEDRTIDARLSARGNLPSPPDLKVIYVDVDTDSITALGNFPWNRAIFAEALDALFDYGKIKGVGFDFVFSAAGIPNLGREEAEKGSIALGRSIKRHGQTVLASSYSTRDFFPYLYDRRITVFNTGEPELPVFPVIGPTWGLTGLIDVVGSDIRYVPLFAVSKFRTYHAFALQLALIHYGLPESAVEVVEGDVILRGADGLEVNRIKLLLGQMVEPNWFSPWLSDENPRAGIITVLDYAHLLQQGSPSEKKEAEEFFAHFRDAIVLVGPTDPLLKDTGFAPLNGNAAVPRVSLHGNLLKTIVSGRFPLRPPVWVNTLIIFGLGLGAAALSVAPSPRWNWPVGKICAVLLILVYLGGAFMAFAWYDWLLPMVAPVGAAVSCTLFALLYQLFLEERRRRRIKDLFGSYVSAAVVEDIVEKDITPHTGGVEAEITAFFSDVVSFTRISEQLSPGDLVALMCEYLGEGTQAIINEGGALDKYVGDAIIAMFGVPVRQQDHAAAACRAALGLEDAQRLLRDKWAKEGRKLPLEALQMRTRIGLNSGTAVVGNVGSALRFNYTMMGDTVNLAARLESAVAHYGTSIMVSAATAQAARASDQSLIFRPLDRIVVAGQTEPVEVLDLLGRGGGDLYAVRLKAYRVARELYGAGRWAEAREAFLRAAVYELPVSGKNPCTVMAERCQGFMEEGGTPISAFRLIKG